VQYLPVVKDRIEVHKWINVKLTAYRPIKGQTDSTPDFTAINTPAVMGICAVSQDLLSGGKLHYGDVILIPGLGVYLVMDTMNARHRQSVDILVYTRHQEKIIGIRPDTLIKRLKD
jgi:3D (Asp-Asp-Asp) domain-containing protein